MTLGTLIQRPTTWRPAMRGFDRLFDDLYEDFGLAPLSLAKARALSPTRRGELHGIARKFSPQFEASELENEYRVRAEVPGVDAKDLAVTVDGGVLTIKGQRRYEAAEPAAEGETRKAEAAVAVRGSFERRLRFPGEIVEGDITACYKNGVLTVTVPKLAEAESVVRSIPVETA